MLSVRAKVLAYFGLVCSIINLFFRALPSIIPFSFDTYNLVNQLYEVGEITSFGSYLILLILSIVFFFMDKKEGKSTKLHRDLIIYTVLYVVGLRGIAPLCFPITALIFAIKNKKQGGSSKSDMALLIAASATVMIVIGLFVTIYYL